MIDLKKKSPNHFNEHNDNVNALIDNFNGAFDDVPEVTYGTITDRDPDTEDTVDKDVVVKRDTVVFGSNGLVGTVQSIRCFRKSVTFESVIMSGRLTL